MRNSGISSGWKSKSSLVKKLQAATFHQAESRAAIESFNSSPVGANRQPDDIPESLPLFPYAALSNFEEGQAIASGLEGREWAARLAKATAYIKLVVEYQFYASHRHRLLWPAHSQPLQVLTMTRLAKVIANHLILGQTGEATRMGALAYAALQRTGGAAATVGRGPSLSYVIDDGEDWQRKGVFYNRRAQAFMLRLFGSWAGLERTWLPYAYDVPAYEWLMENWKTQNPRDLIPALLDAADRHTHEARADTRTSYYDFHAEPLYRYPIEILMLYRLREVEGLDNPVLDHPLCASPFDTLPQPVAVYKDELIRGSLARVRIDSPDFDAVIADAIAYPLRDPHAR